MTVSLQNPVERCVDGLPFLAEPVEHPFAVGREAIKALGPPLLLAPFAGQETLAFEAPQERVEGVLLDVEAELEQRLAEGVAVVLFTKLCEHRDDHAAASELETEVLEA